jgi:integrase/recombinase XerD
MIMDILEKLLFDMQLYGMSEVSQKNYKYHVRRFDEFNEKSLEEATLDDVRVFLHDLRHNKKLGIGTVNYFHTCIKFLFQVTLEKVWNDWRVPRLRGYKTIPVILSRGEVKRLIVSIDDLKYKAILSCIYSAGLRVSEACRLKVKDVDSSNMQIFIRKSKGNKDRYTILSKTNLSILRKYWQQCGRPKEYLFPGQSGDKPLSTASVRQALNETCEKAGITKKITVHTLRHCFSTHLLEAGTNIFALKLLLGHASISSTCRYLNLVRMDAFEIKSPLDMLEGYDDDEED